MPVRSRPDAVASPSPVVATTASATPTVDQVLGRFAHRHGVRLSLTDGQRAALSTILQGHEGTLRAEVYLGMAAAGLRLTMSADPASRERFDALMDTALQLWVGGAHRPGIGVTAHERLTRLAAAVREAGRAGPLTDKAVEAIRAKFLQHPTVFHDEYETLPVLAELREAPAKLPYVRSATGKKFSVDDVFGNPVPRRRITAEMAREANLPVDFIPGTKETWTADGVAKRLDDWMRGMGTAHESKILDLTHALHGDDWVGIAEKLCAIRAKRGDKDFMASGKALTGQKARDALTKEAMRELDDSPFGTTRDGRTVRAQFSNRSGQLEAHDIILQGEAQATLRLLQNCSHDDVRAIDVALQAKPHSTTLYQELNKLGGKDERRAMMLVKALLKNGVVTDDDVQAFEIHEAGVSPWGTNNNGVFRILEGASESKLRRLCQAFHEQYPKKGKPGGSGATGDLRASALYHFLHGELNDFVGGDQLWLERLALAFRGLHYEPDTSLSPAQQHKAEFAHRDNVARYFAMTSRLAGKKETNEQDVAAMLAMVQPRTPPKATRPANGLPTADEIRLLYTRLGASDRYRKEFRDANLRTDLELTATGELEKLADVVLEGAGYDSPAAAAIRIDNALEHKFLLFNATREETIVEVLDRRDLSPKERERFIAQVRAEYAHRFGKDKPNALRKRLEERLGATIELPGGAKIPSLVMKLEANGMLTPADRLISAMHPPDAHAVNEILKDLESGEKTVALLRYAKTVHGVLDPSRLAAKLQTMPGTQAKMAALQANILPHEVERVALELELYLNPHADPQVDAFIHKHLGDPDAWIAKNFGPQRAGLEEVRQLVAAAGGANAFARQQSIEQQAFIKQVESLVATALGAGLAPVLMDLLDPHGHALKSEKRAVVAAARDAEITRREQGHPTPKQLEAISRTQNELLTRVSQYVALKDARVETVANIATTIAIAGVMIAAPEVSPFILMGVGAGAQVGSHLAFGETEPLDLMRHALRGGTQGLLAYLGTQQIASVAPSVDLWLRALQAGAVAAETASIAGAVDKASLGNTWSHGLGRGVETLVNDALKTAPVAFAVGSTTYVVMEFVQRGVDALGRDKGTKPGPHEEKPDFPDQPTDLGGDGTTKPVEQPGSTDGGVGTRPPVDQPGSTNGGTGTTAPVQQPGPSAPINGGGGTAPPVGGSGTPVGNGQTPPVGAPPVGTPPVGGSTLPPVGGSGTPPPSLGPSTTPSVPSGGAPSVGSGAPPVGSTSTPPPVGSGTPAPVGSGSAPPVTSVSAPPVSSSSSGLTSARVISARGMVAPSAGTPIGKPLVVPIPGAGGSASTAVGAIDSAVVEQTVRSAHAGFELAIDSVAPPAITRGLVAVQAHGYLQFHQARQEPTTQAWQGLLDQARRAGMAVPNAVPASDVERLELLQKMRSAGRDAPAQADVSTARVTAQPAEAATRTPAPRPVRSAPASTPVAETVVTAHRPSRAPRAASAAPAVAESAPVSASVAPRIDATAAVANHPRLHGSTPEWRQKYLRASATFLLGVSPGSLDRVAYPEIMRKLETAMARYPENTRIEDAIRIEQRNLFAFGLPNRDKEIDGCFGPRSLKAFENAAAILGRANIMAQLSTYARAMTEAAQNLRMSPTALGDMSGDQLKQFVSGYQERLRGVGTYEGPVNGLFSPATLEAHGHWIRSSTDSQISR